MSERRYDEKELAQILQTAAAEQAKLASESGEFTLTEIERMASEAGIEPRLIANAAAKLDEQPTRLPKSFIGAPVRHIIERNFDGTFDDQA